MGGQLDSCCEMEAVLWHYICFSFSALSFGDVWENKQREVGTEELRIVPFCFIQCVFLNSCR